MIANRPNRYGEVLLEAIRLGAFVDFLMAGAFAKTVIDLRLELIHCHFGDHKLFVGYLCGRLSERPVTVTIHAYELYRNPNPRFFRYVLARVRGIVTIAVYNRKVLQEKWGIPPARVAVIPLFADLPLEPAVAGGDKVTILTVARLVEKKGHRTLIAALARLPLEFESVVVGRGSLNVQDLAEAAGVENRVHVRGAVNDQELQMAYRSATIFCLPSEGAPDGDREGIPVALMEAMAHGLPVVGTRHAGIPELVEEMLVDEGDVDGLAKCLLILGRDPDLRKRLGRKNREIVEARFSRANVLQLESLFRGIVDADR
jgi:glycosyltransferase involved in cell wall biosynthesis